MGDDSDDDDGDDDDDDNGDGVDDDGHKSILCQQPIIVLISDRSCRDGRGEFPSKFASASSPPSLSSSPSSRTNSRVRGLVRSSP